MKKLHTLLVGHGLAGAVLAHVLEAAGATVMVVDQDQEQAASLAAAGLINPITGRRFVKSWGIDELLPALWRQYAQLESKLGQSFLHAQPIIRSLGSIREANDWDARTGDPAYAPYLDSTVTLGDYATFTAPALGYGGVKLGAQLDVPRLLRASRAYWMALGRYQQAAFDYAALQLDAPQPRYQGETYDFIIFCQGFGAKNNPFFQHLPLRGDKGEALMVRIPSAHFTAALKNQLFVVPLGADLYWIGATYENQFADPHPSAAGRAYLQHHLDQLLLTPYEVVDHWAGVRPTVKDRRPLLGFHPDHPRLAIFNGLGTKGSSLAPYWAEHFIQVLLGTTPLDSAVDIRRFAPV